MTLILLNEKKSYTWDDFNNDKNDLLITLQNLLMNDFLNITKDIDDIIFPNVVYFTQISNDTFDILDIIILH